MKSLKIIFILLVVLASNQKLFAANTGCLLPNNQLFTNRVNPNLLNALLGTTPIYQNYEFVVLEAQCISSSKGSCRVCSGSLASVLGLITGCSGSFTYGSEVDYIVNCDIDSGGLCLTILSGATAIWFIYKRQRNSF